MPAMIAVTIYLLEVPLTSQEEKTPSIKQIADYLARPALWAVTGLTFALISQWEYVHISGNVDNANAFASSFTSDLLWYRLWPNNNFPLGVIPAILILSGPLLVTIILAARQRKSIHAIRWMGLIGMLVVMFVGSAVVSTKIGGGGDLHNMDTYAVLVSIVAVYFFSGNVGGEEGRPSFQIRSFPVMAVAMALTFLPLIPMLSPYPRYHEIENQQAHQQLVNVVNEMGKKGPVLFINDRQLVALGEVDVPLIYNYEVVTLMEMAMSGNKTYLDMFYNDLAGHRFAAIVAGRQNLNIKEDGVFAEENNVWNTYVSPYILCQYESSMTIEADQTRLEIYVPRTQSADCPSSGSVR